MNGLAAADHDRSEQGVLSATTRRQASPPIAIQVAFAGHNRAPHLGNTETLAVRLVGAFELLRTAGFEHARLLTGLAEGADAIAATAWRRVGLGPIQVVYPYLNSKPDRHSRAPIESGTWLDGATLEAAGRSAHLAQTRWLVSAADVLVVVWDGDPGRGAGGTADAVRLALEHNVPVIWIKPASPTGLRLIRPNLLNDDFGFLEFLEQVEHENDNTVVEATPADVRSAIGDRGGWPNHPPEGSAPKSRRTLEWLHTGLHRTIWQTYALFCRVMGGKANTALTHAPPADLAEQTGFTIFTQAQGRADQEANHIAAIHRSQQILLLAAAIVAAAIGTSPTVWEPLIPWAASIELCLAILALLIVGGARRAGRHEKWGQSRRLAEQLRIERAAWTLGMSSIDDPRHDAGHSARVARELRRAAGLASGRFDADRVDRWGAWAMNEIIGSQAEYHHVHGRRNERIAHRIHRFESLSFFIFIAMLLVFTPYAFSFGAKPLPARLHGVIIMAGAIVPAVGAASLALEAILGFGDQSRRSHILAKRLDEINVALGAKPRLDQLQQAARAAIHLQVSQEDRWSEDAIRRRLFRGG
jgi:Protein of unknown function (DUF4231)